MRDEFLLSVGGIPGILVRILHVGPLLAKLFGSNVEHLAQQSRVEGRNVLGN